MPGQLIRMFLVDGNPQGIKTMEISNRTIYATMFPRALFHQYRERPEYSRPGVYLLIGQDEDGNDMIYIGEGAPVGERLRSHDGIKPKDFWTDAVVFTSKDSYLTKTQIQYLEAKLVEKAADAGRVLMDNSNTPGGVPYISEADEAEISEFLESIYLFMDSLGFPFFVPLISNEQVEPADVIFEIKKNKSNVHGKMMVKNGQYILLKGSIAAKTESPGASNWVKNNRRELMDKGVLVENDANTLILTAEAAFKSPSGAAVVIEGYSVNGLRAWKNNGKTLAEWEAEE
ncbi:MAG: GIY-YIG nuclease family protein [Oscillospiraceae bacterium]